MLTKLYHKYVELGRNGNYFFEIVTYGLLNYAIYILTVVEYVCQEELFGNSYMYVYLTI